MVPAETIADALKIKIEKHLMPSHVQIVDESHGHARGRETHFTVVVVSPQFEGKSRVDRSRMVMNLFDEERARGLHALTAKTFTPAEWDQIKSTFKLDPPACHGGGAKF